jgi:hypothetical protein
MKRLIFFTVIMALASAARAQEFYLQLDGGYGGVHQQINKAKSSGGIAGSVGAGYVWYFQPQLGIGGGLTMTLYKQQFSIKDQTRIESGVVDDRGSAFLFTQTVDGYREQQTFSAFQIPLFFQFNSSETEFSGFYGRVGAKIMLPMAYKFKASAVQLIGEGYYPDTQVTFTDVPGHGFGAQSDWTGRGVYTTKTGVVASLEGGYRFSLNGAALYIGAYVDFGLSNIVRNETAQPLSGYLPTTVLNRPANGLLATEVSPRSKPLSVGVSLKLGLGK